MDPGLRANLPALAGGGSLVLDYYSSRRCSVTIGDLTAEVRGEPPAAGYVELRAIEGVRVFAEARLLPLLRDAGPSLRTARGVIGHHLAVDLDEPEAWIEFLEGPGLLSRRPRRGVSP